MMLKEAHFVLAWFRKEDVDYIIQYIIICCLSVDCVVLIVGNNERVKK